MKFDVTSVAILSGTATATIFMTGFQNLPTNALTVAEHNRLSSLCKQEDSELCNSINTLVTAEETASGEYPVVMQQGGAKWWLNQSDVQPTALSNLHSFVNLSEVGRVSDWTVRYHVRAETKKGTVVERYFAGDCKTRDSRLRAGDYGALLYLGTREVRGGQVLRQQHPTILQAVSNNTYEKRTLRVACYVAYDLPWIRQIVRQGSIGEDIFQREQSLPEAPKPVQEFDLRVVRKEPYRLPDGTPLP
ncbi:MAG: hypothetical protein KME10_24250 [Plectolyngbya sp. WJT66-NPBG17]|jgi:hypothetical protein|nr:hypothetical protein [Plectolyngbya sp. WJT66-NPBG17]